MGDTILDVTFNCIPDHLRKPFSDLLEDQQLIGFKKGLLVGVMIGMLVGFTFSIVAVAIIISL